MELLTNMDGLTCFKFGRLGNPVWRKKGFANSILKAGRVVSIFLLPPELI